MRSAAAIALLALAPAGIAEAHIHLLEPMARQTSTQGDPQKDQHCGVQGRTTDRVSTFLPGATITVTWAETINHPGYYRISFQENGEEFRIPPPNGANGFPTEDLTGMVDPGPDILTGSLILKDRIPDGTLSTDITLPNIECSNCTLQFIQVMTDKPPYTTDLQSDDIYFNCADIVLSATAPDAGTQATGDDAGVGDDDPNNPRSGTETGGCAAGGSGAGLPAALALLGFVGWRRRRR